MKNGLLAEIIQNKQQELSRALKQRPETVKKTPPSNPRSLATALGKTELAVLAEIKPKSPSKGWLNKGQDLVTIARDYETAGATALSVLTDEKYFGGSVALLSRVRQTVSIPVLRKDFILSECQIEESLEAGADAILLIADILPAKQLVKLFTLATDLKLEAVVEFHDYRYHSPVQDLNPPIVGINCRDLKSTTINLSHFERMIRYVPSGSLKIAESGLRTHRDLEYIYRLGYDAALVGTCLMESSSPGTTLGHLLEEVP